MSKALGSIFSAILIRFFFYFYIEGAGQNRVVRAAAPDFPAEETSSNGRMSGFSLLELILAMTITLVLLGITTAALSRALSTRERESSRTDALTATQAALNVMSREISNAGYGLTNNGIVLADSNTQKLHIRANIKNDNLTTADVDEDITYYYNSSSKSVVRYDPNAAPTTTGVINQVSMVTFQYFDYTDSNSTPVVSVSPTANTGRVRITLIVILPEVQGQPKNQTVRLTSDVTLRNSTYMLNQY